ncbi:MAG TPA: hypothetical protein VFU47_07300, partial [Armatimonadota bacterium]|nr:hypothetical protein [Armatimonadota bacterium]
MKRALLTILALAALLAGSHVVWAMGGTHGRGNPKHPIAVSGWPEGVRELANLENRVSGHWVNAADYFFYEGDAAAFNRFIEAYGKISGARMLVLTRPGGLLGDTVDGDWEMSTLGGGAGSASVTLPLGRRIRLADLKIPAS